MSEELAGPALLAGRVALVVGGSRGIGAATARALGAHGACVGVNYHRNPEAAAKVVAEIEASGSRAVSVPGDGSNPEDVAAMVSTVTAALGDISILVCNTVGFVEANPIERLRAGSTLAIDNADSIKDRSAIQLATTLYPVREVVPGMRRVGSGSIIFVGATASRGRPVRGVAEISVAKAAQDALARALANELGVDGIRVNTVAPGMVPTDANAGPHQETMIAEVGKMTPLGRVASTEDVADVIVALASDLTRHLTGAYLGVDGGRAMM
jgi:3-oxoacyl-[acyl-carrier protein] reductase